MYLDLVLNLAFLVSLSVISGFLTQRWPGHRRVGALLQGALFGVATILGMIRPVELFEGVMFDGRSVMLSMCALFFGPWAALVAALMAAVCRLLQGGGGVVMGLLVIVSSTAIGLIAHFKCRPQSRTISSGQLYVIGLLVHLAMLLTMFLLPSGVALSAFKQLGLPVVLVYPLATILVGKILSDQQAAARFVGALQTANKNLEITLQSIGDAVIATDNQGRIVRMNAVAERLTGWTASEACGRMLDTVVRLEGESNHAAETPPVARVLRDGEVVRLTQNTLLIARDGTKRPIADTAAPIQDEEGRISGVVLVFSDQTASHAARQALAESEERLRLAIGAASQGLYDLNVQTGECVVSPEYARMLGYEPAEFTESNAAWRERLHPEDRESVYQCYEDYVAGRRRDYRLEFRQRTRDGNWRWILSVGRIVARTDDGRALRMVGTHTDVTERRRAEEALQRSERNYREIFNATGEAIFLQEVGTGRILDVNEPMLRLYGYDSKEEVIGRNVGDLSAGEPPFTQAEAERRIRLATEQGPQVFEWLACRKNGERFWAEVSLRGSQVGGWGRLLAVVRDITRRKQTEDRLRLQSGALEAAANAIVITNREGVIEWANPAFTSFTGYTLTEAIGRKPGELLKSGRHEPAVYQQMWQTILAGQMWEGEVINRRKDGTLYTEEMTITPLKDEQGGITHFVAVKQDVTEKRQLEEQFRQAHKMEAIGQLAGGVAHDFNNMLAVILGSASLMQLDLTETEQEEALRDIRLACERASNLTRQLLTFSRRQMMQARPADLNEIVFGMVKMLTRIIGEDVALKTQALPGGAPVQADPGMIEQILLNLVINARDAMPEGGEIVITLTSAAFTGATASHPSACAGDFICLSVRDTGLGIAPEHLPRIFEPFFTTKAIGKGTGLGLATVHGIVAQHRGWIEVESPPGAGANFKIYLPRRVEAELVPAAPAAAAQAQGGSETILLVEDEPALRTLTARFLTHLGYRVKEAASGAEALKLWEQPVTADLLLTDIIMPDGVSGRQLAEQLCATRPGLAVLYMSGYSGETVGRGLELVEGVNFLKKPFAPAVLAQVVRRCLDAQATART